MSEDDLITKIRALVWRSVLPEDLGGEQPVAAAVVDFYSRGSWTGKFPGEHQRKVHLIVEAYENGEQVRHDLRSVSGTRLFSGVGPLDAAAESRLKRAYASWIEREGMNSERVDTAWRDVRDVLDDCAKLPNDAWLDVAKRCDVIATASGRAPGALEVFQVVLGEYGSHVALPRFRWSIIDQGWIPRARS